MTVNIAPDLERFVEHEVASGRFPDRDAVVAHALRWMQRDREDAIAGVRAGLDDVAAGRVLPIADAFSELRREAATPENK